MHGANSAYSYMSVVEHGAQSNLLLVGRNHFLHGTCSALIVRARYAVWTYEVVRYS